MEKTEINFNDLTENDFVGLDVVMHDDGVIDFLWGDFQSLVNNSDSFMFENQELRARWSEMRELFTPLAEKIEEFEALASDALKNKK